MHSVCSLETQKQMQILPYFDHYFKLSVQMNRPKIQYFLPKVSFPNPNNSFEMKHSKYGTSQINHSDQQINLFNWFIRFNVLQLLMFFSPFPFSCNEHLSIPGENGSVLKSYLLMYTLHMILVSSIPQHIRVNYNMFRMMLSYNSQSFDKMYIETNSRPSSNLIGSICTSFSLHWAKAKWKYISGRGRKN